MLDGRPATTHWMHADAFRALFPQVKLDPDVLYVDDGDVLTSAGNAAGIDLCLHIVRRDHGADRGEPGGPAQCRRPVARGRAVAVQVEPVPDPEGSGTAPARAWALERLPEPLSLTHLAAHSAMSVRTFTRRFREETGLSPRPLARRPAGRAGPAAAGEQRPAVERIAADAGFGTAASLRQHLHAAIGVSPGAYRRMYRGPLG